MRSKMKAEIIEAALAEGEVTLDLGASKLHMVKSEAGFTTTFHPYGFNARTPRAGAVTTPTVEAWCERYDYLATIVAEMLQRQRAEAKPANYVAKVAAIAAALEETVLWVPLGEGRSVRLELHSDELDESWILYGPGRKKYSIPGRPWSSVAEWCAGYPELVDATYQAALEYQASKAF